MRSRLIVVLTGLAGAMLVPTLAFAQTPGDQPTPPTDDKTAAPPAEKEWGVGGTNEQDNSATKKKGVEETKKPDADDGEVHPVLPNPGGDADVDLVIGFGHFRDTSNPVSADAMSTLSWVAGFHFTIGDLVNIGARIPITNGSVSGVSITQKDAKIGTTTLGAIAIDGKIDVEATKRVHVPVTLSVYLPTAGGDPIVTDPNDTPSRATWGVQQAAAASRGWEDRALFASKRFGLAPGLGLTYDNHAGHVGATTSFQMMFKTGGNDAPAATTVRGFQYDWVTGVYGTYELLDGKLAPSLRAWLAVANAPAFEQNSDFGGAQFVLEPNVSTRIPLNEAKTFQLRGEVGVIIPVGGPLGGSFDATSDGLRLRADLLF